MNEQLQAELLKIVTNINSGVESAWGFLTEQTPDVVRQLLLWHGVYSFVWFALGFACVAIGVYGCIFFSQCHKKENKQRVKSERQRATDWECISFAFKILSPIIGVISGLMCFFSNLTWLQIWLTPKVWLLEYIQAMVK